MDTKIRQILHNVGIRKFVFFDVGASSFLEFVPKLSALTEMVGFEPIKSEFEKLQKKYQHASFLNLHLENCALGDQNKLVNFIQASHHSMSSLLPLDLENYEKHFGSYPDFDLWAKNIAAKNTYEVSQIKLDSYCEKNSIEEVDFLKLDTQGSELLVLKGGCQLLDNKSILLMKIEVSTVSIYKDQVMFSDIDIYLRGKGYELVDFKTYRSGFTPIFGEKAKQKHHYAPCGDAIYVAKSSFISNDQKIKTAILLLSQGYYSLAKSYLLESNLSQLAIQELLSIDFDSKKEKIKQMIKNFIPPIVWFFMRKY